MALGFKNHCLSLNFQLSSRSRAGFISFPNSGRWLEIVILLHSHQGDRESHLKRILEFLKLEGNWADHALQSPVEPTDAWWGSSRKGMGLLKLWARGRSLACGCKYWESILKRRDQMSHKVGVNIVIRDTVVGPFSTWQTRNQETPIK